MILRDRVPLRPPRVGLAMIGLLATTTIPAWSQKTTTEATVSGPGQLTISDDGRRWSLSASGIGIEGARDPLPPEAQELIAKYQKDQADAWREMEQRLAHERADVVRQLKELQDRFTKAGKLDEAVAVRDHVRALEAQNQNGAPGIFGRFRGGGGGGAMSGAVFEAPMSVAPDPGNLMQFRDRVGQTFLFHVVGSAEGSVWGKGIYTDDSALAAAAVHAGILRPGEAGDVRVKILPGREAYEGGSQNGVDSQPYQAWEGSYQFLSPPKTGAEPPGDLGGALSGLAPGSPDKPLHAYRPLEHGNLEDLHGHPGQTFTIEVTGSTTGPIWGGADNVYSEDSDPATAAVHAGILRPGERGAVTVTILPDRGHYEASTHNLVESRSWGPWHGSYRIAPAPEKPGAGSPPAGAGVP